MLNKITIFSQIHKIVVGMPVYDRVFSNTDGLGFTFNGEGEDSREAGSWEYKVLSLARVSEHTDIPRGGLLLQCDGTDACDVCQCRNSMGQGAECVPKQANRMAHPYPDHGVFDWLVSFLVNSFYLNRGYLMIKIKPQSFLV